MSILPELAELEFISTQQAPSTDLGKTFLFDFQAGEFVLRDGKLVQVEQREALKVWIEKVLRTEKFRFKVYEKGNAQDQYGVTIEDLVFGHNYPQSFLESELRREISSALTKHPMIQSISNWKIVKDNPVLNVSFKVNLADGSSIDQEVVY